MQFLSIFNKYKVLAAQYLGDAMGHFPFRSTFIFVVRYQFQFAINLRHQCRLVPALIPSPRPHPGLLRAPSLFHHALSGTPKSPSEPPKCQSKPPKVLFKPPKAPSKPPIAQSSHPSPYWSF